MKTVAAKSETMCGMHIKSLVARIASAQILVGMTLFGGFGLLTLQLFKRENGLGMCDCQEQILSTARIFLSDISLDDLRYFSVLMIVNGITTIIFGIYLLCAVVKNRSTFLCLWLLYVVSTFIFNFSTISQISCGVSSFFALGYLTACIFAIYAVCALLRLYNKRAVAEYEANKAAMRKKRQASKLAQNTVQIPKTAQPQKPVENATLTSNQTPAVLPSQPQQPEQEPAQQPTPTLTHTPVQNTQIQHSAPPAYESLNKEFVIVYEQKIKQMVREQIQEEMKEQSNQVAKEDKYNATTPSAHSTPSAPLANESPALPLHYWYW